MKVVWRGQDAYCGSIMVGRIGLEEGRRYVLFCLPQVEMEGGFTNKKEAMDYLEQRVAGWFKAATGEG